MATEISIEDLDIEAISQAWPTFTAPEKRKALAVLRNVTHTNSGRGEKTIDVPQDDDELHQWIYENTGFDIPRAAVCPDHQAPFDFISEAYFNRSRAILVLGSREGGKTIGVAILHYANAETKPGIEACTFGAIEAQAKRAYKHVKSFIYTYDDKRQRVLKPQIEGEPKRSETNWKNTSMVEIIVGSKSGVNSPHPNVVHADEIDLMEQEVWDESRNMSSSSIDVDGKRIPALDIATSTRKSMKGLMQNLINETENARKQGHKPAWTIFAFCIFESAAEVPMCQMAPQEEREARLAELGRDTCETCDCDKNVKGEWSENQPRTLASVCRGKFFRSRGWMAHEDVVGKFMQNSQVIWEAQQECRRPMADGLYLENWTRQRFTTRGWSPRPELGKVWQGVDWGGSAPSYVVWIQGPLHEAVQSIGFDGQMIIVPRGAYVAFREISAPGIGATRLASSVVNREIQWRNEYQGWRVTARFADMAGRQQRDDWREHDPPLRTVWYISRDFDPTVECLQDLSNDGLLWVDQQYCPSLCDDFESWRQEKGHEVHDESSHGPAATRYCLTNVQVIVRRQTNEQQSNEVLPVVNQRSDVTAPQGVLAAVASPGTDTEGWREQYGLGTPQRGVTPWAH